LENLKPRLARSGLSNVHPQRIDSERDPRVGRLNAKIDRVLVDAPCSGLGTLRRNPDLKWRQRPEDVVELEQKQLAILSAAAKLVKPGGRLVYATCSLLPEENERVVERFLGQATGFQRLHAGEALAHLGIALPHQSDAYLRLMPHAHGTDGFFAALLERPR
jgi:16S rRNA (cytosine967-C5)-methyltransferase